MKALDKGEVLLDFLVSQTTSLSDGNAIIFKSLKAQTGKKKS